MNRTRTTKPGEPGRPAGTQLHVQRPWETRSFDAALTTMSQIR